jgi:UTP--glucose-1-phosphate uridylyltransferase
VEIKKAVITAAGRDQLTLPLQTLVDRDGVPKSALCIVVEEVLSAGIEEIGVVVHPGDQQAYRTAACAHTGRLSFLEQPAPLGYGHAVACAREFTGAQPFLLLVGDHLYVSRETKTCAQQLVEVARAEACTVSAVQATHERMLPYYGTVGGHLEGRHPGTYRVETVVEKPTPTEAEQHLVVPGLRTGHYLCFFGMHVLTPTVMESLAQMVERAGPQARVHLSAALALAAGRERYLACELRGRRYDIGAKYGLLIAQLALALEGRDRDEVLSGLVELLALRTR